MCMPFLLGCPMCAMGAPPAVFLSVWLGGVLVSFVLLRPIVATVATRWGWPRMNVARYISLTPIFVCLSLLCWIGLQNHSLSRVIVCTVGLVLCALYLWMRGCWLLQQCDVTGWFQQFLFLGILGPGMLIVGAIVGHGIVGLLLLGLAWPSAAIPWFITYAGPGLVLGVLLHGGLCYALRERKTPQPGKH
jgi:hypothetical protein